MYGIPNRFWRSFAWCVLPDAAGPMMLILTMGRPYVRTVWSHRLCPYPHTSCAGTASGAWMDTASISWE